MIRLDDYVPTPMTLRGILADVEMYDLDKLPARELRGLLRAACRHIGSAGHAQSGEPSDG